jgi:alpha-amylase/alpha-mannosidase (GH57 family)
MKKYICIHGHFYQPPREHAWLEAIEYQESADPYHDWNERINDECYGPNAHARILDAEGKITRIVNNYGRMSFNFGPTLLAWMQKEEPDVYRAILEADRLSRDRFGGHGSAMAQVYNHIIMPLANERDRRTQVRWGVADFVERFGRQPEGMWLAETAVDNASLEALAAEKIKFTILEPHQAARWRRIGEKKWNETTAAPIDPRRPYLCRLPSGASIGLFFYDGPISRAVAFERLLDRGEYLANRLLGSFDAHPAEPQFVSIATDGETFGHHHRFGEMALAYALRLIEEHKEIDLINPAQFLEKFPPQFEVEIHEKTAWSCAHGVGRWERDCGCNVGGGPGWNQKWRAPLRLAFDQLRDAIAPVFEEAARGLLRDPWAARDAYIDLILGRTPVRLDRFFLRCAAGELDEAGRIRALKALEMQRHALLMYTSCAWFFDDLSGIETVQVMQYAARAVQLAGDLSGKDFETPLLEALDHARSNIPEQGTGRQIWERCIPPSRVDLAKVAAHYGVSSLFKEYPEIVNAYCYTLQRDEYRTHEAGRSRLAVGRLRVLSDITLESEQFVFAVLYFGEHNLTGGVCADGNEARFEEIDAHLSDAFERADLPEVIRYLDRFFRASSYSLRSLFKDERRWILDRMLEPNILHENIPLIRFLQNLNAPVPQAFRSAAEFALNSLLRAEFQNETLHPARICQLLAQVREHRVRLDHAQLEYPFRRHLERLMREFAYHADNLEILETCHAAVMLIPELPFRPDLSRAQNRFYGILQTAYPVQLKRAENANIKDAPRWIELFAAIGAVLNVRVDADIVELFTGKNT